MNHIVANLAEKHPACCDYIRSPKNLLSGSRMNTKRCPRCDEVKALESFAKDARRKDGLQCYCRACTSAISKAWYEKNRERKRLLANKWRAENKERVAKAVKRWSQANPEKRREASRRYGKAHPEKIAEKYRKWRTNNLERARELARQSRARHIDTRREDGRKHYARNRDLILKKSRQYREHRREELAQRSKSWRQNNPEKSRAASLIKKARKRAAPVGDTQALSQFIEWARNTPEINCEYCADITVPNARHLDHIHPLARGGAHAAWNLCVACPPCNMAKHTMTGVEFRQRMAEQ